MNMWLILIISLSTENATARMRAWRALKAAGAAVLRDGVYLLPNQPSFRSTFDAVAADVVANGGSAYVLSAGEPSDIHFQEQFDRRDEYAHLLVDIQTVRNELTAIFSPARRKNRPMPRLWNWKWRSIASCHLMNRTPL